MLDRKIVAVVLSAMFSLFALAGCAGSSDAVQAPESSAAVPSAAAEADAGAAALADGDYEIDAKTDSSMFRIEACTLHVADGAYTATIQLPGEGFSRLYFGTPEEAEAADDADITDYYLGEGDKYTFDIPVPALDEEVTVAAFGQRRDTWYPHTIVFNAPSAEVAAAA